MGSTTFQPTSEFDQTDVVGAFRDSAAVLRDSSGPIERAEAATTFLAAAHLVGQAETALGLYDIVLAPAVRDQEVTYALSLARSRAEALLSVGDLDGCDIHAAELQRAGEVLGIPHITATAQVIKGWCLLRRGQVARACLILEGCHEAPVELHAGLFAALALGLALRDETAAADIHMAWALAASHTLPEQLTCLGAQTWIWARKGDLSSARETASQRHRRAHQAGLSQPELAAIHDVARLGGVALARRALAETPPVQGRWAAAATGQVIGLIRADASELERTENRFSRLGLVLEARECAIAAAAFHAREHRPAAARACDFRVARLAKAAPEVSTPGWSGRLALQFLTPRERDVAALVIKGFDVAAIADRLGLSTRTVDAHLHRTYAKLGTPGKEKLASRLVNEMSPM